MIDMHIEINGVSYEVPQAYVNQLASDLFGLAEQAYEEKLDDTVKIGLMAITRTLLVKEELSIRMKHGKEAARAMRPPPKADPNVWLARQCLPSIQEMLKNAILSCKTESGSVTSLGVSNTGTSVAGGQMDIARDIGLRENDGSQVP